MANIIAIHDRSLCRVNKRLRINVDRFNSPESCIKFLTRMLKMYGLLTRLGILYLRLCMNVLIHEY